MEGLFFDEDAGGCRLAVQRNLICGITQVVCADSQFVGAEGNGRGFAGAQRQGRAGRIQIVSGTI